MAHRAGAGSAWRVTLAWRRPWPPVRLAGTRVNIAQRYILPMKRVRCTPDALRSLRRHGNMADRVMRVMREYAEGSGARANNVKAPRDSSGLRLRVGDYRVVFDETEAEIVVTGIGPRGRIYD